MTANVVVGDGDGRGDTAHLVLCEGIMKKAHYLEKVKKQSGLALWSSHV